VVVVILPDGGRGYLAKVFNDDWMRAHGFISDDSKMKIGDVVTATPHNFPCVLESQTVKEARDALAASGLDQLPVMVKNPPVRIGHVIGSISLEDMGAADPAASIGEFIGSKPLVIGVGQGIEVAINLLESQPILLLLKNGEVEALIDKTRLG